MARVANWPLIWTLLAFAFVLLEGVALGEPQAGDTLSETIRTYLRFSPIGRFVFLPVWCWLTWHLAIRPESISSFTWRDAIFLIIGLVWASLPRLASL